MRKNDDFFCEKCKLNWFGKHLFENHNCNVSSKIINKKGGLRSRYFLMDLWDSINKIFWFKAISGIAISAVISHHFQFTVFEAIIFGCASGMFIVSMHEKPIIE